MDEEVFRLWVAGIRRATVMERPGDSGTESDRERQLQDTIERTLFADPLSTHANAAEKRKAAETVFNSMRRLDVLEPLLQDPDTTEIMVNGPDRIFVERNGVVSPAGVRFESRERLEDLIQSLVSRVNRIVNESEPIVDARLEDGSRLNAILRPVALDGPLLTIRRFPRHPLDMEQLIGMGAITGEAAEFLKTLVLARYNLFICGGTGSGKTTFLNVLSAYIPSDERIVTIEDSAELQLSGIENLARLETRNANTEGRGGVSMKSLIRTSLRMRPDRIIVGEVRGEEAFDMLQAMNTGHDGSMSTGHANSSDDMMTRLETMVLMAADLPLSAIRKQIASAVEVVVFLQRLRDHSRRVVEIAEVIGCDADGIRLQPLFTFREEPDAAPGMGITDMKVDLDQRKNDSAGSRQTQRIPETGKVAGHLQSTGVPLHKTGKMRLRGFTGWDKP